MSWQNGPVFYLHQAVVGIVLYPGTGSGRVKSGEELYPGSEREWRAGEEEGGVLCDGR